MSAPLAERLRPRTIDEYIGQEHLVGKNGVFRKFFETGNVPSFILWGPPGVGKTTLALAFARALDLKESRVQFTPDVLPSDLVGFSVYQKETGKFVYHAGAVMCNLFLADEINRTSARTQSALLEVMEESAVTVDGAPDVQLTVRSRLTFREAFSLMLQEL